MQNRKRDTDVQNRDRVLKEKERADLFFVGQRGSTAS